MNKIIKILILSFMLNSCKTQTEFISCQCNCYYSKRLEFTYQDKFIPAHDGLTTKKDELPHFGKYPLNSLKKPFPYLYCGIDTSMYNYLNSDSTIRTTTSFTCVKEWD